MNRRAWIRQGGLVLLAAGLGHGAHASAQAGSTNVPTGEPRQRLVAAWRAAAPGAGESADRVGIIEADWVAGELRIAADLPAPGRAHGLLALADGGFLAVAGRPGHWLLRCDAQGQVMQHLRVDDERPARTFNGHVEPSADGRWLYACETDPSDGSGWIAVRDATTLRRVASWPTPGVDPHQLLVDPQGALMVAIGGILRDAAGRKVALERMAPSLARLDGQGGQVLGQWHLPDARLSIRHIAWSLEDAGHPTLGLALQAEHSEPTLRARAPVLAVWDGSRLVIPSADAQGGGYAGDIAPGPEGSFVLSAEKTSRGLHWQPRAPKRLHTVAELGEVCALTPWSSSRGPGVLLAAGRGLARWHPEEAARMLPWPKPMHPDNHCALLA